MRSRMRSRHSRCKSHSSGLRSRWAAPLPTYFDVSTIVSSGWYGDTSRTSPVAGSITPTTHKVVRSTFSDAGCSSGTPQVIESGAAPTSTARGRCSPAQAATTSTGTEATDAAATAPRNRLAAAPTRRPTTAPRGPRTGAGRRPLLVSDVYSAPNRTSERLTPSSPASRRSARHCSLRSRRVARGETSAETAKTKLSRLFTGSPAFRPMRASVAQLGPRSLCMYLGPRTHPQA